MTRKIRVEGVKKEQLDEDKLALAIWLLAKRAVEEKREREAKERAKRQAGKKGRDER